MFRISKRVFSSTARQSYAYPLAWIKDETAGSLALSFAAIANPAGRTDPRIIGWFKTSAIAGDPNPVPTLSNFESNPRFEDLLHSFLRQHIHTDLGWQTMAVSQREGYLNISDGRVFTAWGRVSDPEDLLGCVLLKKGEIVEKSYQRMPTHRIVSSNGLMQLSEGLHSKLVEHLQK